MCEEGKRFLDMIYDISNKKGGSIQEKSEVRKMHNFFVQNMSSPSIFVRLRVPKTVSTVTIVGLAHRQRAR